MPESEGPWGKTDGRLHKTLFQPKMIHQPLASNVQISWQEQDIPLAKFKPTILWECFHPFKNPLSLKN